MSHQWRHSSSCQSIRRCQVFLDAWAGWEVGWWGGRILPAGNTALHPVLFILVVPCGLQDLSFSTRGLNSYPWQCKGGVKVPDRQGFPSRTGLAVLISAGDWRQPRLASSGAELRPAGRWQEKGWDQVRSPTRACSGQGHTPVSEAFLALPHPWGTLGSDLVWTLC